MARLLPIAALLLALLLSPEQPAADEPLTPAQRQAVEAIVRDVILKDPELLLQAIENLEKKRHLAETERLQQALRQHDRALRHDPDSHVIGNPQGDVTVVEFFDYRCGYCKQVQPELEKLLERDGGIRLVLKELPILGAESILASRAAIAAGAQGKYAEFHDTLMQSRGTLNEAAVMQMAAEVGLDVPRLKADMAKPGIDRVIKANYALAESLGIQGTPAFVIGDQLVPGVVGLDRLHQLVIEARSGCATC